MEFTSKAVQLPELMPSRPDDQRGRRRDRLLRHGGGGDHEIDAVRLHAGIFERGLSSGDCQIVLAFALADIAAGNAAGGKKLAWREAETSVQLG